MGSQPFSNPQISNPFFSLLLEQKEFFSSGATLSKTFRLQAIEKLKQALKVRETQLLQALNEDLGKSFFEGKERKKVTALRNANAKLKASSCKSFSFSQKIQINFRFFA